MTPERRCVVLILDGLGDRPIPALGGRTPLEAARTPRLDRLAATGRCGLVDPVEEGRVPNTHTGVGVLFGLRPEQRGLLHRGPIEAAGAGIRLQPGDIAFRANLAMLERRAGRPEHRREEVGELADETADRRRAAARNEQGDYAQREVTGAVAGFPRLHQGLLATVRGWLASRVDGRQLKLR